MDLNPFHEFVHSTTLPIFKLNPNQSYIIQSPKDFLTQLKLGIQNANNRIIIASLYIGSGEEELIDLLNTKLSTNSNLKLVVLIDYFRGSRLDSNNVSSYTLLSPLVKNFPDQVKIHFYHAPVVSNLVKRIVPPRFIEGFGLQHIKTYGFDNDIIISGANLNKDYFENRQDRYIQIKNHENLSDYNHQLINTIGDYSYTIQKTESGIELKSPFNGDRKQFINNFRNRILQLTDDWNRKTTKIRSKYLNQSDFSIIIPALQMYPFGIQQDELTLMNLLKHSIQNLNHTIHIASGYFNLPQPLESLLLKSQADIKLLTAAPTANGFYNSKGVSKYIPSAYSYLQWLFMSKINSKTTKSSITFYEYQRPQWTWHAKGVWIIPKHSNSLLTVIGSSNLNHRSWTRDLETQLYIISHDDLLTKSLKCHLDSLYADSRPVDLTIVGRRRFHVVLKLATRIIRNML